MDLNKLLTVENLLKVLLAIAIGVMLYKVFFAKETYYNYKDDKSGYAYPSEFEEDDIDIIDAMHDAEVDDIDLTDAVTEDGGVDDIDLVDSEDDHTYDDSDYNGDDVDDEEATVLEEIEDVLDEEDDIYEYADEENDEDAYDDSEDVINLAYKMEDMETTDEIVYNEEHDAAGEEVLDYEDNAAEEKGVDEIKNFDYLYSAGVEDGLQESFMLYSNLVGVDTNYSKGPYP